jgi:hypothetical protein
VDDDESGGAQVSAVRHGHLNQAAFRRILVSPPDARDPARGGQLVNAASGSEQGTAVGQTSCLPCVDQPDQPPLAPAQRASVGDDDTGYRLLPPAGGDGTPDPADADADREELPARGNAVCAARGWEHGGSIAAIASPPTPLSTGAAATGVA